jgi:hypothetical protein
MKYLIRKFIMKLKNWNCPYCGREDCGADCGGHEK